MKKEVKMLTDLSRQKDCEGNLSRDTIMNRMVQSPDP